MAQAHARASAVSIHSAGLPAEKRTRMLSALLLLQVSIHSAGLPAEKRMAACSRSARSWFQSTPLVFQRRNDARMRVGVRADEFQSTPLVFQRRNMTFPLCVVCLCASFNPLRWSSSGET